MDGRWKAVRRLAVDAARGTWRDLRGYDLTLYSAALTFYAIIAVIPLLLVAVWVLGVVVGPDSVRQLSGRLTGVAPSALGFAGELKALTSVGTELGGVSLAAAVITGTTYGEGFVRVFERLYRDVDRPHKALRGRLLSLPPLVAFPLFVGAGLTVAAALTRYFGKGTGSVLLGAFLAFCIGWAASTLGVVLLYRLFGPVPHGTAALWLGSAAAASFLTGMSEGWLLLLSLPVDLGRAYGGSRTVAGAAAFAAWLFLVHFTLIVGLLLTRRLSSLIAEPSAGRPRLPDHRRRKY